MLQTVVTFLGREKCWVLTSGRQCFCRQANFSLIQSCYHLISPQTCQCCVNITCNSDVKWRSTLKYVYVLGQWMGVRLTYIIFCNSVFHVKIFQILSLDLFSLIVFFFMFKENMCKNMFYTEFCLDLLTGCFKVGYTEFYLSILMKMFRSLVQF